MRLLSIVNTRQVYDWVFNIYVPIAIGVFVLFVVLIVGAVFIYRRRDKAARWHENNLLEGSYAVLLTLVAAFLLYITFTGEHREDLITNNASVSRHDTLERPAVTIDVTASRWEWTFTYPGHTISHQSGAVGHQPLVVPAREPIRFNLRSDDVIHSFWIPYLKYKHDAIAGSVQSVTLYFDRSGTFSGSCAEYCGLLHSYMVFTVQALPASRFRTWLSSDGRTST